MFRLPLWRRLPSTAFRRYSTASGAQAHTPPRPPRSLARSTLFATTAALASYAVGSLYPPDIAAFIAPRTVPPPPPPDHPDAVRLVQSIEDQLHALPLVQKLRDSPDADEWYETRPYARIPEAKRVHHLTTGALRGPGKLAVAPLVRARKDETESIIFVHLGRGLCGHDGIIHGGLLATLLDESLARTAILNLPERIGVTANLSLNYRAPTRADQFVVIKTKLEDLQGRKARVSGIVEDINGTVLVEAKGMFVQPRYAKLLNSGTVRDALGAPPAEVQPKQPAKEMIPTNTSTSSAA